MEQPRDPQTTPASPNLLSAKLDDLQHQTTVVIVLSVVNGLMNIATIAIAYLLSHP